MIHNWHFNSLITPKHTLLLTLCVAAGFAIAAVEPPRTIPLNGTFGTTFTSNLTDTPGVFDGQVDGVGTVLNLGFCTIAVQQTVDFRTDPSLIEDSTWTLTFANADQLMVNFEGTGTFDPTNPAFAVLSGAGIITGGTGRFENATGDIRIVGVAHGDTPAGVFPAFGHGAFTLEGLVRLTRR